MEIRDLQKYEGKLSKLMKEKNVLGNKLFHIICFLYLGNLEAFLSFVPFIILKKKIENNIFEILIS